MSIDEIDKKNKKIKKRVSKNLIKDLQIAVVEKDVEIAYKKALQVFYPNQEIVSPYDSDGILEDPMTMLKLLIEVKYNENFKSRKEQCKVMVQALYYIKNIEKDGEYKPNVVLIGDKNECFVIHGNRLYPYLEENIDWNIAPSSAALKNPQLVLKLQQDHNILPFVFSIDNNFNFGDVINIIESYSTNQQRQKIKITERNIARIYDDFLRTVITSQNFKNYTPNQLVSIFIQTMTDPIHTYIVPTQINRLHLPNGEEIEINGFAFDAFFCQFDRNYTPMELDVFTAIADRLLEETSRRFQGSFWTPNIWVDKAHDMLNKELGVDWKETMTVWDSSCGSMNLTRDYHFNHLYCSTIFQEELDIGSKYNLEATKFQYDFLNDDLENELLCDDIKLNYLLKDEMLNHDRPILFFNNPPYAQAGDKMGSTGGDKKNVANTLVNKYMIESGAGQASQQLYAQFLWRIMMFIDKYDIKEAYIGLYSPPLFLTGDSYKNFREKFFNYFEYKKGILFQASSFADVRASWGISFTIFRYNPGNSTNRNEFPMDICSIENGQVICTQKKTLYNTDGLEKASQWVRFTPKESKKINYFNLSSAIKLATSKTQAGTMYSQALGYFMNDSNNIYANSKYVGMFSAPHSHGHGLCVFKENFDNCISLFCARTLIKSNWINQKDEYLKPNTLHPKYNSWLNDCLIYSIFSTKSSQSAMKNIVFNGVQTNLKNEWFWMSKQEMLHLANTNSFIEMYNNVRTDNDRFVYNRINHLEKSNKLSPESIAVLHKAREIVKMTIEEGYRYQLSIEHPEYHLDCWDAGWYQIKLILKEYSLQELEDFNKLLNKLENKMFSMIYELGFLK